MGLSPRRPSFNSRPLARLQVLARSRLVPAIAAFVKELAIAHGFSDEEGLGLELGTEELCVNVAEHAYEGDENAEYTVEIILEAEALVVAVEDQGVPFDPAAMPATGKLGTTLARAFADDLRFLYRGRKGKRVELRKHRKFAAIEAADVTDTGPVAVPADEHLDIRLMRPEDAPALACCVWRVFGYSYPNDDLYEPERLAERLRSGAWQSCVAVRASGEILGHIGLVFHSPDDRVPESDNAIVAPYARGHRLMERMKSFLAEHGKARGLAGIFSEAVTAHIYSQRANVRMGAVETGLMLGYLPKSLVFKDMELPPETVRVSAMMYFLALTPAPRRTVHAPARHVEILKEIFQHAGLARDFADASAAASPLSAPGSVQLASASAPPISDSVLPASSSVLPAPRSPLPAPEFALTESADWNVGTIEAQRYGEDWSGHLRAHVDALCRRGMAYILLELPLADAFTPTASVQAEALGFFFCGVVPEKHADGDLLRFQYWNNFSVPTSSVQTASDFGLKLRDYVGRCVSSQP